MTWARLARSCIMSVETNGMSTVVRDRAHAEVRSRPGTPVWEIAHLFPQQGRWSEEAYLALDTNHLIEFKNGCLEFLPMPDLSHQCITRFLFLLLHDFVTSRNLGEAFFAPLRTRTVQHFIREPDVVFARPGRIRKKSGPLLKADLVVEVVSEGPENRKRDLVEKRREYAAAAIREYWIVDPKQKSITVLSLRDGKYRVHGKYARGDVARSALLPGFEIDVTECLAAGDAA
jgi:Uma2 family endonuclease